MKKKNLFLILFAVLAVLLVAAGAYFVYNAHRQARQNALKNSYAQMYRAVSLLGGSQTIAQLREAVIEAHDFGTINDVAEFNMLLATSLLARNQGGDQAEAIGLLKQIAADSRLTPQVQGEASLRLADWSARVGNQARAKDFVFNTPPYSDYLAQENGDVSKAVVHVFGVANALYPTTLAYYQLARLSALDLRNQGVNVADKAQLAQASSTRASIALGDKLLPKVLQAQVPEFSPDFLPYLYLNKSIALSVVKPYFTDLSTTTVAQSFETAILSADTASTSKPALVDGLSARLSYAAWLNTQEHGIQNAKIQSLLEVVSTPNSSDFDQYVTSIGSRPTTDAFRRQVVQLAELSSSFAAYLTRLGWKL